MRRLTLLLATASLAACAKKEEAPPAPPPPPPAPVAPAPIDLATVAGTWNFNVMGMTGDSVLTTYTLVATGTTDGWMMTLKGRKPMALTVTVSGDSIMASAPEYESVLRKGQKVQTNTTLHLVGDKLMGTTMAHYRVKTADSLVTLRSEGTRAPK